MKERPILFSAPMVRAILAGTKTQTRRAVAASRNGTTFVLRKRTGEWWPYVERRDGSERAAPCPYGKPGDRLWVRESFMHEPADYVWEASVSIPSRPASTVYRADFPESRPGEGWSPSIHMPRALSRITLEVVAVRVERLQDISEEDARAEGVAMPDATPTPPEFWSYAKEYGYLWDSINGPGSWDANPWVWVVQFKVIR